MAFYLRTWELTDDLRPQWPTVYTPDMVLACCTDGDVHEVTLIGPCARWGHVPQLHHCNPYLLSEQHIAVELWGQLLTSPADLACDRDQPKAWSYQVFPRLALTQPQTPPWEEDTSPHTWTDPESPEPDPVSLPGMEAAVYTARAGHAWGTGPHPVTLGADGEPDAAAFRLAPHHRYLQAVVTMPPEQALAYTPDAHWRSGEDRDVRR